MQTIRAQVRSSQRINVGISYPQRVTAQIRQGFGGGGGGGGGYQLVPLTVGVFTVNNVEGGVTEFSKPEYDDLTPPAVL